MSINPAEDRFLDYLEGRLNEAERGEFERALLSSPELKRQLQEYVAVSNLGDEISKQEFDLGASFTSDLMQRIDIHGRRQASSNAGMPIWVRRMLAPAALCATAVVALLVTSTNKSMNVPIVRPQHSARSAEQAATTVAAAGKATGIPSLPKGKVDMEGANEFVGEKRPTPKAGGGAAPIQLERSTEPKINDLNQEILDAESSPTAPGEEAKGYAQPQEMAPLKESTVLKAEETTQKKLAKDSQVPAADYAELSEPAALEKMNSNKAFAEGEAKRDLSRPSSAPVESDGIEAFGNLAVRPQAPAGLSEKDRAKQAAADYKAKVVAETARLEAEVSSAEEERQGEAFGSAAAGAPQAPSSVNQLLGSTSKAVAQNDLRRSNSPTINADQGSFAAVANSIAAGRIPDPSDVKPEALINRFNFGYASAVHQAAGPFAVYVEAGPSPFEQDRMLVMIGLKHMSSLPAANLRFRLYLDSKQVVSYRSVDQIAVSNVTPESGSVEAGDEMIDPQMLLTGRSVTMVYEIALRKGGMTEGEAELGIIKLSYSPSGRRDSLAAVKVPLAISESTTAAAAVSSDFKFAAAVNYFCKILRGDRSIRISDVLDLAQKAKGNDTDGMRSEFIEVAQNSAKLLN